MARLLYFAQLYLKTGKPVFNTPQIDSNLKFDLFMYGLLRGIQNKYTNTAAFFVVRGYWFYRLKNIHV